MRIYTDDLMRVVAAAKVGDFIWMEGERAKYTIQARSIRFLILTKPFNLKHTCLYSVVDLKQKIRGVDNWSGLGYETREECEQALEMFKTKRAEFSRRNPPIELVMKKIQLNF